MRQLAITLAMLGLGVGAAHAQDPVKVDPRHYRLEFENDQVRILRVTYGPGEKSPMHEHPALVAVALSDAAFRMMLPDGTTNDLEPLKAGGTSWSDAQTHAPANIGKNRVDLILIELKSPQGQQR
jgi:predicted metal-dependent enzyme (double-stranded beta helix superfamily)